MFQNLQSDLSQLQIVKVAIETIQRNETLLAIAENVYITFKGLPIASVGELEHVDRKVIVRRVIDERIGCITLLGGYGFSIGEVAEERDISRPSFISLYEAGKFIPYRGPMTGPPLGVFSGGRRSRKASSEFRDKIENMYKIITLLGYLDYS